jgi:hypothetical protein
LKRYHAGAPTREIFATAKIELMVREPEDATYPDQISSAGAGPSAESEPAIAQPQGG